MNFSSLASLGKVAGVGGISLGIFAQLVGKVIDRVSTLPAAERAPTLRFISIGAFAFGVVGIFAWVFSGLSVGNVTASSGGVAAGRDISGSITTYAPQPASALPASAPPSK